MLKENNDTVIITLDRPRELRLSHKVLKRFFALHHLTMATMDRALSNYDTMISLLLCMLQREDPDLTADRLDDLLDDIPLHCVTDAINAAVAAAFPDAEEDASQDPRLDAGTGINP